MSGTGDGSCISAYKIASSSSETSGTWTNNGYFFSYSVESTTDSPLQLASYNSLVSPVTTYNQVAALPALNISVSSQPNIVIRLIKGLTNSFTSYCTPASGFTLIGCLESNPPYGSYYQQNVTSPLSQYSVNSGTAQGWSSFAFQVFEVPQSSNTYVPIDTELSSLQCVNNSPTTTCSFEYSTTSTSTAFVDYSDFFTLYLIFIGLCVFALVVYLFRSLALRYL